jgi:hypothetical protein
MKATITNVIDELRENLEKKVVTNETSINQFYGTVTLVFARGKLELIRREETIKCRQ